LEASRCSSVAAGRIAPDRGCVVPTSSADPGAGRRTHYTASAPSPLSSVSTGAQGFRDE